MQMFKEVRLQNTEKMLAVLCALSLFKIYSQNSPYHKYTHNYNNIFVPIVRRIQ
jgi:hypothetical protein